MATVAPQMLTANRLKDGDVLYWKAGTWVENLRDGDVFAESAPAEAALAAAQSFVAGNIVVNPYLFDVRLDAAGIHPVKEREIIRAAGPSVREDLGKQSSPFTSPLWGGRERSERVGVLAQTNDPHPMTRAPLASSTSPQGGGENEVASEDGHVSI